MLAKLAHAATGGVSRRLASAFPAVSLCAIVLGAVGVAQLNTAHQKVKSIRARGLAPALAVSELGRDWFTFQYYGAAQRVGNQSPATVQADAAQAAAYQDAFAKPLPRR